MKFSGDCPLLGMADDRRDNYKSKDWVSLTSMGQTNPQRTRGQMAMLNQKEPGSFD